MLLTVILTCALLGIVAGFLSGLLGIGGGLVIVPALAYLLPLLGFPEPVIMQMAVATSLATIVLTSGSSALAHHKNNNIPWDIAIGLMISIALGALTGAKVADLLSTEALTKIFSVGVSLLAVWMIFSIKSSRQASMPGNLVLYSLTYGTGLISSLMGIGGGAILVPLLSFLGLNMRFAIGIASACSMMVAFFGSLGFVIAGLDNSLVPEWSIGYVYLPALVMIISTSVFAAPFGVRFASELPVDTIKKIFAGFLIITALEMMFS
jgi:uncharacterized membrane protein YfcA